MSIYYRWRVFCTNEGVDKFWVLSEDEPEPTSCPTDTAHSIDATKTVILNTISDNMVKIQEENIQTGGNFQATTLSLNAIKNTTSPASLSWPHPISALNLDFISTEDNKGDIVNGCIGKDTIIGNITGNVTPAIGWTGMTGGTGMNYVVGDIVTYTHPIFGQRTYTCIQNTVSSELPTNSLYWKHGFELNVSASVIQYTLIGYHLKLDDLSNNDDLCRVIGIDKNNSKVYVEVNPSNSYSFTSPTYIRQTVYTIFNYEIGSVGEHEIGSSKIGGSYIPADTFITIEYINGSTGTDKKLSGRIEYLY